MITLFIASSFKICPRNSQNLAKCVKESIELIRPRLKTGDLGDGVKIEALEPIKIDDIVIHRGDGFYVNLSNLKAFGATNFKVEKLRINVKNFKVDAVIDLPKLEAFGKYKLQMVLGILNLKGEGNMKANLGMKVDFTVELCCCDVVFVCRKCQAKNISRGTAIHEKRAAICSNRQNRCCC